MRRILTSTFVTAVAATTVLTGAGQAGGATSEPPAALVTGGGTFVEFEPGAAAVTYDTELVPVGARARVVSLPHPLAGTHTGLGVQGLVPDREYGAHVHTKPCGETGEAAGPHFQFVRDPVQPSVDPAYANPDNEIWLDFTTDGLGRGFALSHVDWQFPEDRRGQSVVIHETHTHTEPGNAGNAGARLACINVAF
jgi:Cu-Zn family superoxide dismutase